MEFGTKTGLVFYGREVVPVMNLEICAYGIFFSRSSLSVIIQFLQFAVKIFHFASFLPQFTPKEYPVWNDPRPCVSLDGQGCFYSSIHVFTCSFLS